MNMLDVHAEALETSSAPYHEFLLTYRALRPIVYGFVEGREDPSYYRGFIENTLPDGWAVRLIRSGNRQAVLDILLAMPWQRFPKKRICFYVDRDLSEYLNTKNVTAENLYITDNYSIESDVVNVQLFERSIEEVFGVTEMNEDERETARNQFEENIRCFCDAMTPVMAQILIWRRNGVKAPLSNIKLQSLFLFSNGRVETAHEYASPMSRVGYAAGCVGLPPSDEELVRTTERELRSKSSALHFVRGKYLLWVLVESAVALHKSVTYYCKHYSKPPKIRVTLGAANALTILGPRARIPNSLKRFIEANYLDYIQNTWSMEVPHRA